MRVCLLLLKLFVRAVNYTICEIRFFSNSHHNSLSSTISIVLTVNIANLCILFNTNIPPIIRAMCSVPVNALETAMARRVFRDIKLGLYLTTDSVVTPGSNPSRPTGARQRSMLRFATLGPTSGLETGGSQIGGDTESYEMSETKISNLSHMECINTESLTGCNGSELHSEKEYTSDYGGNAV